MDRLNHYRQCIHDFLNHLKTTAARQAEALVNRVAGTPNELLPESPACHCDASPHHR